MAKKSKANPFLGLWTITAMGNLCEDFFNDPDGAFVQFKPRRRANFGYNWTSGNMVYQQTTLAGRSAVEWTWEGQRHSKPTSGTGLALILGDELHGAIVFDNGHEQPFVASQE
jgi:hypothetical protein